MRRLLICLAALACLASFAHPADKKINDEQRIGLRERAWAAAQKTNDVSTVASLLADDYIEVLPDGSLMNKSQVLDDTKNSKYESVELSDLKITIFGDTAIVTGIYDARHSDKDGKPLQDHERYVDTWRKMPDGKWRCIAEGNTAIR